MNNDDERDYAEEAFNANLMREEEEFPSLHDSFAKGLEDQTYPPDIPPGMSDEDVAYFQQLEYDADHNPDIDEKQTYPSSECGCSNPYCQA